MKDSSNRNTNQGGKAMHERNKSGDSLVGLDISMGYEPQRQPRQLLNSNNSASTATDPRKKVRQARDNEDFRGYQAAEAQRASANRRWTQDQSYMNQSASMQFEKVTESSKLLGNSADTRFADSTDPANHETVVSDGLKSKTISHRDTMMTAAPSRNCAQRVSDWFKRQLTVTSQELLNTNDVNTVKKRRMKIYSISNLICFLIQVAVFVTIQYAAGEQVIKIWHWESIQHDANFTNSHYVTVSANQQPSVKLLGIDPAQVWGGLDGGDIRLDSEQNAVQDSTRILPLVPLQMQNQVESFGWASMFFFQSIFVLRGLPCFNAGQHYVNCLLLKIRFSFCFLCLALTSTIAGFVFIYELKNMLLLLFPIVAYIFLKIIVQYLIYQPLKYKDDGRDVVSFIDFITIHVTFPTINAWISYNLYFSLMVTVATVCDTKPFEGLTGEWCHYYSADDSDLNDAQKYVYFYGKMIVPSVCVFALLFVEASVNLTYYKDCVFAFTVFMLYFGMLWVNMEFQAKVQNYDSNQSAHSLGHHIDTGHQSHDQLFEAAPTPIQFLNSKEYRTKADYQKEAKTVIEGLVTFIIMTFVWILVTLITDWSTVFYRKHIIYKKRMGDELVERNGTSTKSSFVSLSSSQQTLKAATFGTGDDDNAAMYKTRMQLQTDTSALIQATKEDLNRRQHDATEKQRSGSFGLFQDFQQLIQNVPGENSSPALPLETTFNNNRATQPLATSDESQGLGLIRVQSYGQASGTSPSAHGKRDSLAHDQKLFQSQEIHKQLTRTLSKPPQHSSGALRATFEEKSQQRKQARTNSQQSRQAAKRNQEEEKTSVQLRINNTVSNSSSTTPRHSSQFRLSVSPKDMSYPTNNSRPESLNLLQKRPSQTAPPAKK